MKRYLFTCVIVLSLTGCASMRGESGGFVNYYTQSRSLSEAQELLEKGDTGAAAKTLAAICDAQAVSGVTDEALFRLALLSLKPSEKESSHAQQLLSRLQKEFPASQWSVQSAPLLELLNSSEELRRQNRSCKNLNQSLSKENQALSKENKELLQNIEKLKQLDLELEKKNR